MSTEKLRENSGEILESTSSEVEDLGKVDSKLMSLYRRAAGAEEDNVPVMRAALFNLIVYASTDEEAGEAAGNVAEVAGLHPCRAVIIDAVPPLPNEPEISASVICGISERGERRLCGDIIRLHAREGRVSVVGSVMPILVPDVPVYLWVPGEIPHKDIDFEHFADLSSHLIFDSRRFGNLAKGLMTVKSYSVGGKARIVEDLSWVSLGAWRESMAEHFDPPQMREYLGKLNRIVLEYVGDCKASGIPSAPLLFLAWFIDRTGLEIEQVSHTQDGSCCLTAKQDGRHVDIELIPTGEHIPGTSRLKSVTVEGGDPTGKATFVTKEISVTELSAVGECKGVCYPPVITDIPPQSESALAATVLGSHKRDWLYECALELSIDILGRIGEG